MENINPEVLNGFAAKCDALCSSKLILSDKKVSDILKCIAKSEDFCKFMESCIKDFNFKIEFMKAKAPSPDKQGKSVLKLPEGEKLAAFVFCLLCEFDNKERDLTEFLTEYFGLDELFSDGFANFCNAVIAPFKETVLNLAGSANAADNAVIRFDTVLSPEKTVFSKEEKEKLEKICGELIRNITRESQLESGEREEYIAVVNAFLAAAASGDGRLVKVLLISLKYMCKNFKFLSSKVKFAEKVLSERDTAEVL